MKIRIKFSKTGPMKFIGHLDVMRYFQKAMRRALISIRYTEGYSPHQIMSFAAPLGIGLTSEGEYMDIEVLESASSDLMIERLNKVMAENFRIISYKQLPDESKNAMASVAAADYSVSFRAGHEPLDIEMFFNKLQEFLSRDTIIVTKKTKKSIAELDIRHAILEWKRQNDSVFFKLKAGSVFNLKPELVMNAFYTFKEKELNPYALLVHRLEMYGERRAENNQAELIPLEAFGVNIP